MLIFSPKSTAEPAYPQSDTLASTDGRIAVILKRKADETKTSDLAKSAVTQAAQAKQKLIGQLNEKWTADESVIEAARRTIEEKLSALGAKFAFQARPGSPGTTVATAVFTGQVGAASGRMTFNVFETGLLKTYFERTPKTPIATREFSLLEADQVTYENCLLDFVDVLT
jgi:hypothetical protein